MNRFLEAVQARRDAEHEEVASSRGSSLPDGSRDEVGRRVYEGARDRRSEYYDVARAKASLPLRRSARELGISADMMRRIRVELGLELHPKQPPTKRGPRKTVVHASRSVLSARLRDARLLAGLTFGALAKQLGIHPHTVSDFERGASGLKAVHLVRICQALGVSADWLLGLSDNREVKP